MKPSTFPNLSPLLLPAALAIASCGGELDPGVLEVAIYGEEYIEEGIPAEDLVDGWTIAFQRFDVSVQDISAARGHEAPALRAPDAQRFDLTMASGGAGQLVIAGDVPGGAYDHLAYQVDSMHVEGSATRGEERKTFSWALNTPTRYSECEGIAMVDGGTERTQLTLHADHLFYDDLVSSKPNVAFDLIAAADDQGDGDGAVTQAELAAMDITGEPRYQVGNATDVTDLWTFIDRQSSTVGHVDGEGHCGGAVRQE